MADISVICALPFCAFNCPAQPSPHELGEARRLTEEQQSCLSLSHPAPQVLAVHSFLDLIFSVRDQHKANKTPSILGRNQSGSVRLSQAPSTHSLETHLTQFLHLIQFSTRTTCDLEFPSCPSVLMELCSLPLTRSKPGLAAAE